MIALGIANGWIWRRLLTSGFFTTLVLFAVAVALLFALDFFILLQNSAEVVKTFREHMTEVGPARQIGLQVVVLSVSTAIGYGVRRLWSAFAGALG
jgi:hypothetical protein